MTDPKKALDAALAAEKKIDDLTVYPITLARYALLELVKSPFVTTSKETNPIALIPTIFICCAERSELAKFDSSNIDELKAAAFNFADSLEPTQLGILVKELDKRVRQLLHVTPQIPEDANVKKKENSEPTE